MNASLSRAEVVALDQARWSEPRIEVLRRLYPQIAIDYRQILQAINKLPGLPVTLDQMRHKAAALHVSRQPSGTGKTPWLEGAAPRPPRVLPHRVVRLPDPGPDGIITATLPTLRDWCHAWDILGYDGRPVATARLNLWRAAMGERPVRVAA